MSPRLSVSPAQAVRQERTRRPPRFHGLQALPAALVFYRRKVGQIQGSVFNRWSDGSTANPRAIIASPSAVYTLVWSVEYRLTRTVSGQGSVSGADGFYPSGSNVSLTATPGADYHFPDGLAGAADQAIL